MSERDDALAEKRATPRVQPFVLQCSLVYTGRELKGYLVELSLSGARIASEAEPFPAGTQVRIEVRFARRLDPASIPARVMWVHPGGGPKGTNAFGISFADMNEADRELLDEVLSEFRRLAALIDSPDTEQLPTPTRRGWIEGPLVEAPPGDWLAQDDDELLFRIEALPHHHEQDDMLMRIVESERHFFIRQEAAKKIRDPDRLKKHSSDRHIGQILARVMARDEDEDYLRRLMRDSQHLEVRKAAEAQLQVMAARKRGKGS